jgi:hypothetical protein
MRPIPLIRNCERCGARFSPPLNRVQRGLGKFCSLQCYWETMRSRQRPVLCAVCGKTFTESGQQTRKFCSIECAHKGKIGRRWKSSKPPRGRYVAIRRNNRADWEHREIAERALGKPLPPKAHVHHFDDHGRNNTHTNLVVCQDIAYHKLLHRRQRIKQRGGDPNTQSWCGFCKALRPNEMFWVRKTGPSKGQLTTTCKLCGGGRRLPF